MQEVVGILKRSLGLAGAVVLLTALGACTGSDDDDANRSPAASPDGSPTQTATPGVISPTGLPRPPRVTNPQGGIRGLTLGTCRVDAGEQRVTGQVRSPAANTADFLVSVAWTTDRGDVLGRGFAVIRNVPAGATRPFEITATVADGATRCVPNVQFGQIA